MELAGPATGAPASALAAEVQATVLRNGLIIELGGRDDRVIRLFPALNVTAEAVVVGVFTIRSL